MEKEKRLKKEKFVKISKKESFDWKNAVHEVNNEIEDAPMEETVIDVDDGREEFLKWQEQQK